MIRKNGLVNGNDFIIALANCQLNLHLAIISFDPPRSRPVKYEPEYGKIEIPVEYWIVGAIE
jgi:hypothetical protein